MSNSQDIISVILTSALVSSLITFLLRVFFENRQQHRFDLEIEKIKNSYEIRLEKIKTGLALQAEMQHGIIERRIENYPKIVELIYRTRNLSREIVSTNANPVMASEFQARAIELENMLYESRIDLERDGIFTALHSYKNLLKTTNRILDDISIFKSHDDETKKINELLVEIKTIYEDIELTHKSLIDEVSSKTMKWTG
jgi:hypothetical protein